MSFNTQNYWTEIFAFVSTISIPVPVLLSNALQDEYIKSSDARNENKCPIIFKLKNEYL